MTTRIDKEMILYYVCLNYFSLFTGIDRIYLVEKEQGI
jgi:TM2 domain-containing membrane protein YozV